MSSQPLLKNGSVLLEWQFAEPVYSRNMDHRDPEAYVGAKKSFEGRSVFIDGSDLDTI